MKKIIIFVISGLLLAACSSNQPYNLNITPNTTSGAATNVTTGTAPNASAGTGQKVFTLEELKKYNGQNGNPAYVAVNGVVYDVTGSRRWTNGLHEECSNATYAGADLTSLISSSPHGADVMKKFTVVGTLQK
jgi:predicted heme/steroid binding protein